MKIGGEQMKRNQGITLIALVITIIVLLILAGVTISLVIGDNGILNRATEAGEEYIKASIKEEIELAIMDINAELATKNPPQGLTKQEIIDRLQDHIKEIITIDNDMTGEYKGYNYWIDEKYEVHIGDKVSSIGVKLNASIEKIGTSYFTIKAEATSTEGIIVGYIYTIDGIDKPQTTNTSYTQEGLGETTQHTAKVKAIDEKGNVKESRTFKITTESRIYLYKEGNECTDITGGWERTVYNTGSYTKESTYMNLYSYTPSGSKYWNGCNTTNKIKLEGYKTIYYEVEYDNNYLYNQTWMNWLGFGISAVDRLAGYDDMYYRPSVSDGTQNLINQKQKVKQEIGDVKEGYVTLSFLKSFTLAPYGINLKIYNVWLEV